ncbi:MAG: DUF5688 family protein [Lachnospiraceae bacterium]|nr:DUF5688 family protein [Lachnospiraceae bacterium]
MMTYKKYIERIKNELQMKMGAEFLVLISQVKKNNGVILQGISITDQSNNMSPVFYLTDQYKIDVSSPEDCETRIRETIGEIIRIYYDQCLSTAFDLGFFRFYANVKEKVLFRLINFQKNKDLLAGIPHKCFYDLALVFYCDFSNNFFENGTILLDNSHLTLWGVSLEEVFADALHNTPKLRPAVIKTMAEVMKELLAARIDKKYGGDDETKILVKEFLAKEHDKGIKKDCQSSAMYVAGNQQKLFGAAVLLYPDFIKNFADRIGADLYIFPSSIHEIILSPAQKTADRAELLKLVCEINETQVDPEEVLADTVYYYNRSIDVIELIS